MMAVELSELSRCCIVYLIHSDFSSWSEVPLPPPSGSEPQAQVGLNLGSDKNPPRQDLHDSRRVSLHEPRDAKIIPIHLQFAHKHGLVRWTTDQRRAHCSRRQSSRR